MNCTEFEVELIEQIADPRDILSEAARRHRKECAECRRLWSVDRGLDPVISTWRAALPQATVSARNRIVTALLADRAGARVTPQRSTAPRPIVHSSVLSAIAVLLSVGLALWWNAGPQSRTNHSLAQRDGAPFVEQSLPISESVATLWDDVQSRSQEAAVETVRRLEEWPQIALHQAASPVAPLREEPTPATPRWLEWGEPLGRQVGQAFQFLGDALPDPNERPAG